MSTRFGLRRAPASESTLIVPVPEAAFVWERWAGELGLPALAPHATVLYPFLDPQRIDEIVERELAELAGSHPPFHYTLSGIDRFPRVLYLSLSPPDEFIALTRAVQARWPSHPPYGGLHEEIVPHVTLAEGDEPPGVASAIMQELPVAAYARELALLHKQGGTWRTRARFPLGGGDGRV